MWDSVEKIWTSQDLSTKCFSGGIFEHMPWQSDITVLPKCVLHPQGFVNILQSPTILSPIRIVRRPLHCLFPSINSALEWL